MLDAVLTIVAIFLLLLAFYKWATQNNDYFEKRNIKSVKPTFLLGYAADVFSGKKTAPEFVTELYQSFPNEKIYGIFKFRTPWFFIRDPELIKQICIKDFDHFEQRHKFIKGQVDEYISETIFSMDSEPWRQMRPTLSPAFTGKKMRQMFELVSEVADNVVYHLLERTKRGERLNIELKEFFSRFSNDVIASCAFGLKVNSFAEPNNEFYLNGKKMIHFNSWKQIIKRYIMISMPKVARMLNVRLTGKFGDIFNKIILDTMEVRKRNKIYRPDMINIMMQVREGTLKQESEETDTVDGFATVEESEIGKISVHRKWNDIEIVAQCFSFFFAGLETGSSVLTFTCYELAIHPDIQQKLFEEIAAMNEQIGGKPINYDALQKLKYLDQVISETLRKWPPALQIERKCTKNYVYDNGHLKFSMKRGQSVFIPAYAIQHDEKYFPNPEKFDPERFNDDNKGNIKLGTYMPFGIGPRNCIGSRFGLMEVKAMLYNLLLHFLVVPNEKSVIPLVCSGPGTEIYLPRDGVYFDFKPRKI